MSDPIWSSMLIRLLECGGCLVNIKECNPVDLVYAEINGDIFIDSSGNQWVILHRKVFISNFDTGIPPQSN